MLRPEPAVIQAPHAWQPWQRRLPCPYLVRLAVPGADGEPATPPVFRCRLRPGVQVTADYTLDLCSGRAYPASACVFYRTPEATDTGAIPDLARTTLP
jgi:hypothetical protein